MTNLHNKQVTDIELICISGSSNRSALWCQAKVLLCDEVMMSQEFILTPPNMLQSTNTHAEEGDILKLTQLFMSILSLQVILSSCIRALFLHEFLKMVYKWYNGIILRLKLNWSSWDQFNILQSFSEKESSCKKSHKANSMCSIINNSIVGPVCFSLSQSLQKRFKWDDFR